MMGAWLCLATAALPAKAASPLAGSVDPDALAAAEKVAEFFATQLALSGGYVYAYSADLKGRRAEGGKVDDGVVWNQPPGTPAVGGAFLRLYEITGEPHWLDAARAAATVTVGGQLLSGGWYNFTETLPGPRAAWCYRSEVKSGEDCKQIKTNKLRNYSSLDDNITQSNLGFLMWYDEASKGSDQTVREAIDYGLDRLLAAQFPNGAWPLTLDRAPPPDQFNAGSQARFPVKWSRTWVEPDYPVFVLNDQLVRDVVRLLLAAERHTQRPELLEAAKRGGDFLLAAQMPEPQRGWAQTYNLDMEPVWGRKFEPPAIASHETAGSIEALLQLYLRTSDQRYLTGAVQGAAWLRENRRVAGDWARFYELESNRPIFVRSDGDLTFEETDLHKGYGFAGEFGIPAVLDLVDRIAAGEKPEVFGGWDWVFEPTPVRGDELRLVTNDADAEGRVVEDEWIHSATMVQAVRTLLQPSVTEP